ncbi:MAG: nucleotidyltransferase domain-containing protein [Candidatus Heimdallarchaeum aukensis]|uniref:Nucleotidyltransferase domain-containing protein n=1 Tax=Candidatus Heimdallarchaeum aukensis TaxID=2876573 RepID=A0A9Y1BLX5_9ARCH|nr:MAG: nucleotidyltransferase domain-containing protein [Candidatus Heimdallarchaeum aukensis]
MAKLQDELIKIITNQIEKLPSRSKIVSVLLGGSYASGTFSETSDIDLLVISKKASQDRIYTDIKDSFRNLSLQHKLDIKIISMEQIHTLSNSTSAPFFIIFSNIINYCTEKIYDRIFL